MFHLIVGDVVMRVLIFCVFVACCQGYIFRAPPNVDELRPVLVEVVKEVFVNNFGPIHGRALLDGVNETLQDIINGLEDPFEVSALNIDIPDTLQDYVSGTVNLTNLRAEGQKGLKVPLLRQVLLGGLGVNISFSLESFELTTDYDVDIFVPFVTPDFNLKGTGKFDFHLEDLTLDISTHFNTTIVEIEGTNTTIITLFGTRIVIDFGQNTTTSLSEDTTGLGDFVIGALNDNLKIIRDDPEAFSDTISPVIEDIVNEILLAAQLATTTEPPTTTPLPSGAIQQVAALSSLPLCILLAFLTRF